MNRLAIFAFVAAIAVAVGYGSVAPAADADTRPNILYIMSDDHAAHAIGAYGGRLAALDPTPTIDRLAREGMLFTNVFATNSICTPSRACVLTGQYPHTNGVYDLTGRIEPARQFLAIEMKKAGYQTAMIGKWHLKEEPAAFDYYCVLPGQGRYHDPDFRIRGPRPWPKTVVRFTGKHSSDAITDVALQWLQHGRDKQKPFFLMLHYKAPHDFFDNARRYQSYLADVPIPEPPTLADPFGGKFGSIATRGANDELIRFIGSSVGPRNLLRSYAVDLPRLYPEEFPPNYDPARLSDREIQKLAYNAYLRKYLRCVKGVDDNLARVFRYLDQSGLMDRTLIVYTADQGFMLGEHDYQDKRWMYEESQRMPFLIRYPKLIRPGTRSDALIENVDFAPTLLDFAGVPTPSYMQGRSFRSICETGREPDDWRDAVYYRYWMHMAHHFNPAHVGLRTKRFKLIFYYGCDYQGGNRTPPGWELYDVANDPHETTNLYDDPRYAEVVTRLKQRLARLRQEVGDTGKDFPKAEEIIREFWDYDEKDRLRAIEISHEHLKRAKAMLAKRRQ
ncbi:MAG: DUF4976 domain-containing protein [Planctomycetota bacterium]|nr:MAG: DUF4976 domain-containing protein [Planctomycetota bacterium]